MKCLNCDVIMTAHVATFDYTKLAGSPRVAIFLRDMTIFACGACEAHSFVQIPRIADLERELTAAKVLRTIKQIWCVFDKHEWKLQLSSSMSKALKRSVI